MEPPNQIWVTFNAFKFQLRLLQLGFLLFIRPPSAFIDLQKRKHYATEVGKGMTCMCCEWRWRSYIHSGTLAEVTGHQDNWYGVVAVMLVIPFLAVRESRMCSLTFVAWTARVFFCCFLSLLLGMLVGYVWEKNTVTLWGDSSERRKECLVQVCKVCFPNSCL